jgi:hypothetical protein
MVGVADRARPLRVGPFRGGFQRFEGVPTNRGAAETLVKSGSEIAEIAALET